MPVINVAYEINQEVFYVTLQDGVREGVVRSSAVSIKPTATLITYDIAFKISTEGSSEANQDDIYPDVDQALTAYKVLLEC